MERHLSSYPGVQSGPPVSYSYSTVIGNSKLLTADANGKIRIADAAQSMIGYDRISHVPKSSFRDTSMCIIIPTRDEFVHIRWLQAFNSIIYPMNQRRYVFFVSGGEVGKAYDEQVAGILQHPELSTCRYVLTFEDDMLLPPDCVMKLTESIEVGPFDAISGMYWVKGDYPMPQIYGDPAEYASTGRLDFRPRDPTAALSAGNTLIECNGIAMGCSLYRMELFRQVPAPWFVTLQDPLQGASTQDLYFCRKAKLQGKRFAVDMRVRCGHADWKTGQVW